MRYKNHFTLMLIVLIISVFYLQRVTINSKSNLNKDRVILNQKMSILQFKRRNTALRREVDMIAGQTDLIDDNVLESSNGNIVKDSKTIVYNRIDKAGSTTLISKFSGKFIQIETFSLKKLWKKWHIETPFIWLVMVIQT